MQSLLDHGHPVASSCNGDGVCAKCKIEIVSGSEFLNPPNETEIFLKDKNNIPKNYRISCQTIILDEEIKIDATYW